MPPGPEQYSTTKADVRVQTSVHTTYWAYETLGSGKLLIEDTDESEHDVVVNFDVRSHT